MKGDLQAGRFDARGLSIVERAISTRDIRPALMGIQLEAMPGELRLAGYDLEMRIEYVILRRLAAPLQLLGGKAPHRPLPAVCPTEWWS